MVNKVFITSIILDVVLVLLLFFSSNDKFVKNSESKVKQQETTTVLNLVKLPYKELGKFKCTAYCPCKKCSGEYGDLTATGVRAKEGRTVAVDPKVIPYGSIVIIKGKEYRAEDCGSAIKNKCIDIYFNRHKDAKKFGVKYLKVKIKNGDN